MTSATDPIRDALADLEAASQDDAGQPADPPADVDRVACPQCGCHHLPLVHTRPSHGRILRRHQCRHCGRRLTTYQPTP